MPEMMTNLSLSKLAVLVIDDIASARKVLRRMLGSMGFEDISEAQTGAEAFQMAAQREFDLIITDFNLGDLSGIELIGKLREQGVECRFVLVTGERDAKILEQVTGANLAVPLSKPFSKEELRQKILSALSTVQ